MAEAPSITELLPQLSRAFADKTVTSYNLVYDARLVRQSLIAMGSRWPAANGNLGEAPCIMELYAAYWGSWNYRHRSYTWQSLSNALSQCGLTVEGPLHRALADARAVLAVLRQMAETTESGNCKAQG